MQFLAVLAAITTTLKVGMRILRNREDVAAIAHPDIHALFALRLRQLGHFDDGLLLLVEMGDSVDELEAISGVSIPHDLCSNVPFGHPDFTHSFDFMEAHQDASGHIYCYELHQDTGDDGIGITIFVPSEEGIADSLLALCRTYSVNAER
jgi:hypothetical protein